MPFENRQLPLPPVMNNGNRNDFLLPPTSGACGHLHIDICNDLWKHKGRLGQPWDYPTEQSRRVQAQQHSQYAAEKAQRLSSGVQQQSQGHHTRHSFPASQPTQAPPLSSSGVAIGLPTADSLTATAGPQDYPHSGDDSGYAARLSYSQHGNTSPNPSNPFPPPPNGEPMHTDDNGVPLYAPSPKKSTLPKILQLESLEDLSGYPHKIRQALESSAHLNSLGTMPSNGAAEYEVVQESYIMSRDESEKEVVGVFKDRHTANMEAAKMFLHRFWVQVMEYKQEYRTHMGEAGILTMDITTEDAQGERKWSSVFVRRKGDTGKRGDSSGTWTTF